MFSHLQTPVALLPMKEFPVQLNWEMGRTHSQPACLEEGNNFLPLLQIEPQAIQPTTWSLYQLHCIGSFITSKTQVKKLTNRRNYDVTDGLKYDVDQFKMKSSKMCP